MAAKEGGKSIPMASFCRKTPFLMGQKRGTEGDKTANYSCRNTFFWAKNHEKNGFVFSLRGLSQDFTPLIGGEILAGMGSKSQLKCQLLPQIHPIVAANIANYYSKSTQLLMRASLPDALPACKYFQNMPTTTPKCADYYVQKYRLLTRNVPTIGEGKMPPK